MVNRKIFKILERALDRVSRAKARPKAPNGQVTEYGPFFSSLHVKRMTILGLEIMNGGTAKFKRPDERPVHIGRVEVRMGDYNHGGGAAYDFFVLPEGLEASSSRIQLEHICNEAFWDAVDDYNRKHSKAMGRKDERQIYLYFSREKPVKHIGKARRLSLDLDELEDRLKMVSRELAKDPRIRDSHVSFYLLNEGRYFVNSEGSRIFTSSMRYDLSIELTSVDSRNLVVPHGEVLHGIDLASIPDYDSLMAVGEKTLKETLDLVKARIQKNVTCPAILDNRNHGVLWHEVAGHALEAHRMHESEMPEEDVSSLFIGNVGGRVAPSFLSLYDDPTREDLNGHYLFDEDGVRGQRVKLIRNGVLKGFLHSRQSAGFFKRKSNGHARAFAKSDPCPRMSNLIVESSHVVSYEELKEHLVRLCKDQHVSYGLLMKDCYGGLTLPEECFFSTYPAHVFRVYSNGREERVRGIYLVGTPLQTLSNIVITSDQPGVFRGSCLAESGHIPITVTAPDALVSSLEVNRIPKSAYREVRETVLP